MTEAELLGLAATVGRLMTALKATEDALAQASARVAELEKESDDGES